MIGFLDYQIGMVLIHWVIKRPFMIVNSWVDIFWERPRVKFSEQANESRFIWSELGHLISRNLDMIEAYHPYISFENVIKKREDPNFFHGGICGSVCEIIESGYSNILRHIGSATLQGVFKYDYPVFIISENFDCERISIEILFLKSKIKDARLTTQNWMEIIYACSELNQKPIYVSKCKNICSLELSLQVSRIKRKYNQFILILDLWTKEPSSSKNLRIESESLSDFLKFIAEANNIAIVKIS